MPANGWLVYRTPACRYVFATGDTGILDESYYDLPARSHEAASLYEHRAARMGWRVVPPSLR